MCEEAVTTVQIRSQVSLAPLHVAASAPSGSPKLPFKTGDVTLHQAEHCLLVHTRYQQTASMANSQYRPTRILVEVSTSSTTLDKSSHQPFVITLSARVDNDRSVTADVFRTLLWPRSAALDYQGLTLKDIDTGALAQRGVIDICYRPADRLTGASTDVVQLPPRDSTESYAVSHSFQMPVEALAAPSAEDDPMMKELMLEDDQTIGLIAGHTYEIGLGTDMSEVSWWREGNKSEVFLRGPLSRHDERGAPLEMELVNTPRFEVIKSEG